MTKLTLPEVIGASVLAFSTVAVKVTFDPVIAVFNDDWRTVIEVILAWAAASDAADPLSMVRSSSDSRTSARAPGDDASPEPRGAQSTASIPHWLPAASRHEQQAAAITGETPVRRLRRRKSSGKTGADIIIAGAILSRSLPHADSPINRLARAEIRVRSPTT